ncbi:MAG: hypothetical protein ACERKD_11485 [Prolixibacteraceae bacterium]
MKKLSLIALLIAISGVIFAQQTISFNDYIKDDQVDDQRVQTVFNSFEVKRISGFGGPTVSYSTINGEMAVISGGGGGIIINNLFVGGYGEGLSNIIKASTEPGSEDIQFGHGGFWLGYEIAPSKMIHPVISSRLGWGSIKGIDKEYSGRTDNVFVVVPTLSAEINFTRFFKVNVGVEYRQVLGISSNSILGNNDFSNVGVFTSFIFGWF